MQLAKFRCEEMVLDGITLVTGTVAYYVDSGYSTCLWYNFETELTIHVDNRSFISTHGHDHLLVLEQRKKTAILVTPFTCVLFLSFLF